MNRTTTREAPFESMQRRLHIERRRTTAELAAFDTFIDRVQDIPTTRAASLSSPSALIERAPKGGLASVRDAYRSTVMAVPHYEEEYDNDFAEDVIEEFGSTIATILEQDRPFDARTKQTLLALAVDSQSRRMTHIDLIDAERESIEAATERLRPIAEELDTIADTELQEESFGSLDAYRARMDTLVEKCDTAAEHRQNDLFKHQSIAALPDEIAAVPLYLYQRHDSTFPILAYVAALGDQIVAIRSAISRTVSQYKADRDFQPSSDTEICRRTGS